VFWRQVAALRSGPVALPERSDAVLEVIEKSRRGGLLTRVRALFIPGFVRQTWAENLVFRLWFLLG
jgi:hypothetical protein